MLRTPTVSLFTATAIVIANMIGTGIFTSLGFQAASITSGFALLALWVIGGVVALCGALSYAELAAALPRSGGEFHFLSRIFHPAVGFVAGWTSATVGFAAPLALAAMAFGKYFATVLPFASPLMTACVAVTAVTTAHLFRLEFSSAFQNSFTLLKLAAILTLIFCGALLSNPQPISFLPSPEGFHAMLNPSFAISLVYVMYAYSGWNAATYITGEVRDPARNLPRALFIGTACVLCLYVALNWVFLRTTPIAALAGQLEVAHVAAAHIFGPRGGRIMSAAICLGLIASLSAMTWAGPRVMQTMGQDVPALRLLARTSSRGIPVAAILIQFGIVLALLWGGTFEKVLVYVQFTLILCSFLTVCGVIYLRFSDPRLARPYRVWAYPVTPLLFLAVSLWILIYIAHDRPWESVAGLATMLSGLALHFLSPKPAGSPPCVTS